MSLEVMIHKRIHSEEVMIHKRIHSVMCPHICTEMWSHRIHSEEMIIENTFSHLCRSVV